jgi:hypothetical protein
VFLFLYLAGGRIPRAIPASEEGEITGALGLAPTVRRAT